METKLCPSEQQYFEPLSHPFGRCSFPMLQWVSTLLHKWAALSEPSELYIKATKLGVCWGRYFGEDGGVDFTRYMYEILKTKFDKPTKQKVPE